MLLSDLISILNNTHLLLSPECCDHTWLFLHSLKNFPIWMQWRWHWKPKITESLRVWIGSQ